MVYKNMGFTKQMVEGKDWLSWLMHRLSEQHPKYQFRCGYEQVIEKPDTWMLAVQYHEFTPMPRMGHPDAKILAFEFHESEDKDQFFDKILTKFLFVLPDR